MAGFAAQVHAFEQLDKLVNIFGGIGPENRLPIKGATKVAKLLGRPSSRVFMICRRFAVISFEGGQGGHTKSGVGRFGQ